MSKDLFLRKSKKGNHLYTFAGKYVLVISVEDIAELIDDEKEWIKVSVMKKDD